MWGQRMALHSEDTSMEKYMIEVGRDYEAMVDGEYAVVRVAGTTGGTPNQRLRWLCTDLTGPRTVALSIDKFVGQASREAVLMALSIAAAK